MNLAAPSRNDRVGGDRRLSRSLDYNDDRVASRSLTRVVFRRRRAGTTTLHVAIATITCTRWCNICCVCVRAIQFLSPREDVFGKRTTKAQPEGIICQAAIYRCLRHADPPAINYCFDSGIRGLMRQTLQQTMRERASPSNQTVLSPSLSSSLYYFSKIILKFIEKKVVLYGPPSFTFCTIPLLIIDILNWRLNGYIRQSIV